MKLFQLIEENNRYIAVNKYHGALSQSGKDSARSVLDEIQSQNNYNFLHLLNRVDRPVGGLVLLAKSRSFLKLYLDLQEKGQIEKKYIALVEGVVQDTNIWHDLKHYLRPDRRRKKAILNDSKTQGAKGVELRYRVLKNFDRYTALVVDLKGGKFHQIRAQLGYIDHPIRGDVKYGARRGNRDRSIDLHGIQMSWSTKKSGKVTIEAPILKSDHLWQLINEEIREKK